MKLKTAAFAICIVIGSASLMSGCATNGGDASPSQANIVLAVQYSNPSDKDVLDRLGLLRTFHDYWQFHLDRDWKRRYALEKFPRPVEERFYVAYHANAWPLRLLQVTGVSVTDQDAIVSVALTFADPDKKKDVIHHQQSKWTRVEGSWRHLVSDPMLSGFSQ